MRIFDLVHKFNYPKCRGFPFFYTMLKSLTFLETLVSKQRNEEPFGIQQVRSSDISEENYIKPSGICLSINFLGL